MSISHTIKAHAQEVINQTKIKGGCQLGRKVSTHNSKNDLPLDTIITTWAIFFVFSTLSSKVSGYNTKNVYVHAFTNFYFHISGIGKK